MQEDLKKRVNFEIIRYANCWEDADILLAGLAPEAGSKLLSIGSAGDNSFSLLVTQPKQVIAIDINPIQLFLIALKKACFLALSREETLAFLGFSPCTDRRYYFEKIKPYLENPQARQYWETQQEALQQGIIYQGKFEKYFRFFSHKILPFIHSKRKVASLLSPKSAAEQAEFYHKKWNTWRWRLFFNLFFSKYMMGKYGRDPEFLKQVQVPVARYIYQKAAVHLQSTQAQNNFILRFNLTGNFGDLLPHYLRAEHYDRIQQNIDKLIIQEGYAQEAIQKYGAFDGMNLSNIFEYMDKNTFVQTSKDLLAGLQVGGKVAYWNLMVPRQMSQLFPDNLAYQKALSENLTAQDKGFFYNQFLIEVRQ